MTTAFIRAMQTPKGIGQTALQMAELLQTLPYAELANFIRSYQGGMPYWIALDIALPPPPSFEQFMEARTTTLLLLNYAELLADSAALENEYRTYLSEIEAHQQSISPRVRGLWTDFRAQFSTDDWSGGIASWVFMLVAELIAPSSN